MPLIGVRELRQRTAKVLRRVREEKAEYVITYQGRPIALLLPVDTEAVEATMVEVSKQSVTGGWDAYARVAEQVRQAWPAEQETQQVLDEIRRCCVMFTIDASVHINALSPTETGSSESQLFLERVSHHPWPVFSPTLLLVEVAAAIARVLDDTEQGQTVAQAVRGLPGQMWISLDETLADEAVRLASEYRLRGADAVYAAVAQRYETTLITLDRQQLERLRPALPVLTPAQASAQLDKGQNSGEAEI